jgi:endonuclease/exonuclease/phosphatase family metal-dependent hydrolase
MHLFVFIVFLHGITSKSEALDDSYMNCSYNEEQIQKDLRIMTFNIWMSGSNVVNGINKIARHINTINPDVVCLQEVNDDNTLAKIVEAAGKQWKGNFNLSTNNAIMAKNSNVKNEFSTDMVTGVTITNQSGHSIRVVSAHLEYTLYGPYVAMNKLVKERSRLMTAENGNFR